MRSPEKKKHIKTKNKFYKQISHLRQPVFHNRATKMAPTTRTQPAIARPKTRLSSSGGTAVVVVVVAVVVVVMGGSSVVVHQGTVVESSVGGGGGAVVGGVVKGAGSGVGPAVVHGGIVHGDGGVVHPPHGCVGKRVILEERKKKQLFYPTEK